MTCRTTIQSTLQSARLHLVVPRARRPQVYAPRVFDLRLDPLSHGSCDHSRHLQHVQGRPKAVLGHLWRVDPQRRRVYRHVRVSNTIPISSADLVPFYVEERRR